MILIKSLIKSSTYSGLASLLSYGLTIILARNESQIAFAEFTYSIAWALVLTQVIDLAATQCLTHFKISSKEKLEVILSSIYWAKLVALFMILSVMIVMRSVFGFDIPFSTLFFLLPAFFLGPVFEMRLLNVLFAKILFVEKATLLLFCYFYLKSNPFDILVYVAYFVISVASLTYQFKTLNLRLPKLMFFDRGTLGRYFDRYWSIFLTLASQLAYGHISRIIIEAKLGMLAFVSVSLALQIVNALTIIQTQVDRHLRPKIVELIESSNVSALKALSIKYVLMYLLPLVGGCLVLYLFANEIILFLFGVKWMAAAAYLQYLVPLIITVATLRYLDIVVVALGVGRVNLGINALAALILVCSLLLMPVGRTTHDYLLTIVGVQILHIAMVITYLSRNLTRSKEVMPV